MQVTLAFASVLVALLSLVAPAQAQDGQARAPARADAFFRADRVNFWGELKSSKPQREAVPVESIWAEPIRLPDGRVSVYVPPAPVLGFMENPTRETGEKYLAWQEARMRRIKAGIEILRAIQAERQKNGSAPEQSAPEPPQPVNAGDRAVPSPAAEILYFKKEGCPWCREEDKVLAALTKEHSALKVRTATPAEAPELWKEYGVTAVPTLVVRTPAGKAVMFRGFTPVAKILEVLQEASREEK